MENTNLIPVTEAPYEVQAIVAEISPLWEEQTGLSFPGIIYCGPSTACPGGKTSKDTWWVAGEVLPAALGPMFTRKGTLCAALKKVHPRGYRYRTAALSTVLRRLKKGLPVFSN
jgi:hypothetical protein